MLNQSLWRKIGAACIAAAACMAVYAGATGLLRDAALHLVRLFSDDADAATPNSPFWFHLVFWCTQALLILIALYMALLDMKYIRLQYLSAKRDLFQETMTDQLAAKATPGTDDKAEDS